MAATPLSGVQPRPRFWSFFSLRITLVIHLPVTCNPIVNLIVGLKTRYNTLSAQYLRADLRVPKLDVVGSNPIGRFL
jgi:hypothetical protein